MSPEKQPATRNPQPVTSSLNLAYIIYTSGSTGRPKGVIIRHQSLVNLCYWHNIRFSVHASERATKFAGFGFDASVWEIFPYLIAGASLYMVPLEIKSDIFQLNAYFEKHQITIAFLPTQLCEQFVTLKNRFLRVLLTGGDKLKTYSRTDYQWVNNYGPTENTVVTTSFPVTCDSRNIPIGQPIFNTRIYILDKYNHLQPAGVPGELCISGESLATGYLNDMEKTQETFIGNLFSSGESMYKTGDLARWLPDNRATIEFSGRKDYQVKIRGFRVELGEIENRILTHEAIKEAVVIDREHPSGDKYLCAYIVPVEAFDNRPESIELMELKEYLSHTLPDYMIPSFFIPLEKIPLTTNDKVDRKALPEPGPLESGKKYTPPRNKLEEKLVEIWADILDIDHHHVGIDSHFFELGGHSLKATLLITRIHKELNIKIPLPEVFKTPTVRSISGFIKRAERRIYEDIEAVEKKDYYPLSSAQKRLFFLEQFENIGVSYNIPGVFKIQGKLERERLENAFKWLIERHESLRTSFEFIDNSPVQRVHNRVEFNVREISQPGEDIRANMKEFVQPFDLRKAPLLRIALQNVSETQSYLFFDMNHIVSDGTSMGILFDDLAKLYQGGTSDQLTPLKIQYNDFSIWQNRLFEVGKIKDQEEYWLKLYSGEIPRLKLPTDYPRPETLSFEGDSYEFVLNSADTAAFLAFNEACGVTLYMNLMGIFNVLLYKYSGQNDIVVGTGIMGRRHHELEKVIGMFVNSLAMRNYPVGEKTYLEFLMEVKENSLKAFENQDFQFEELVDKLWKERDPSRNPLFDVVFVVQNFQKFDINVEGITFSPCREYENKISKFDITLFAHETGDHILFYLEYSSHLFKKPTIEKFAERYMDIIRQVVKNKEIKLKDINISHDLYEVAPKITKSDFVF